MAMTGTQPSTPASQAGTPLWCLQLTPLRTSLAVEPIWIAAGDVILGAGADANIRLPYEGVADRHCAIHFDGAQATVRAMNPLTWINDGPVREQTLLAGDVLCLGPVELRIGYVAAPSPTCPPPAAPELQPPRVAEPVQTEDHPFRALHASSIPGMPSGSTAPVGSGSARDSAERLHSVEPLIDEALAARSLTRSLRQLEQELEWHRSQNTLPAEVPEPSHSFHSPSRVDGPERDLARREEECAERSRACDARQVALQKQQQRLEQDRESLAALEAHLRAEQQAYDERLRSLAADREEFESAVEALDTDRQTLRTAQSRWDRQRAEQEQAIQQQSAELARLADEAKRTAERLDAREQALEARLALAAQQEADLDQRHAESVSREEALQQRFSSLDQGTRQLHREQEVLRTAQLAARKSEWKLSQLEDSLREVSERLQSEEERLSLREAAMAKEESRLQAEADRLAVREQELDSRELELNRRGPRLDVRERALADRGEQLEQEALRLAEQADDLARKSTELAQGQADVERREVELESQRETLEADRKRLREARQVLESEQAAWEVRQQDLDELAGRLAEREGALAAASDDLDRRIERLDERQAELEERSALCEERSLQIEEQSRRCRTEIAELEHRKTELQARLEEVRNAESHLSDQMQGQSVDHEDSDLPGHRDANAAEVQALLAQRERLDEEALRLESQRAELSRRESEIDAVALEHDRRVSELEERRAEVEGLARELTSQEVEWDARLSELDVREHELSKREAELAQRETELENHGVVESSDESASVSVHNVQSENLANQVHELQRELERMQVERSDLQHELTDLRRRHSEFEEEHNWLKLEADRLKVERQELALRLERSGVAEEAPAELLEFDPSPNPQADGEAAELNDRQDLIGRDADGEDHPTLSGLDAGTTNPPPELEWGDSEAPADCERETSCNDTEEEVQNLRSHLADLFGISLEERRELDSPEAASGAEEAIETPEHAANPLTIGQGILAAVPSRDGRETKDPSAPVSNTGPVDAVPPSHLGEDDCVESYMQRLLSRVNQGESRPPEKDERAREPERTPTDRAALDSVTAAAEPPEVEPSEPADATAASVPPRAARRLDDRQIADLRANIDSMRQIANQSARAAVARHYSYKLKLSLQVKIWLTVACAFVTLVLLTAEFWGSNSYRLQGFGALQVTLIAGLELARTMVRLRRVRDIAGSEEGAPASGESEDAADRDGVETQVSVEAR